MPRRAPRSRTLALGGLLALSCEHGETAAARADRAAPELSVSLAGCEALFVQPGHTRCARDPEAKPLLSVWVPGTWRVDQLRVEVDGELRPHTPELDAQGALYHLPLGASERLVVADASGSRHVIELAAWRPLPLPSNPEQYGLDPLDAKLLRCAGVTQAGLLARARASVVLALLARLRAQPDAARSALEGLIRAKREVYCADQMLGVKLYATLLGREDRRAAAQLLEQLRHDPRDLEGLALHDYFLGMLRERQGDLDGALEAYEDTIAHARRASSSLYLGSALSLRAKLLARLGRYTEAQLDASAALASTQRNDPLWEYFELNATWADFQQRERSPEAVPSPVPRMRALLERLESEGLRPKLQLNLAAALLQSGELDAALLELRAIEGLELEPSDRIYAELLAARLALAHDELERAHVHLDAGEREASLQDNPEFMLDLLAERARLELLRDAPQRALELYVRAEALADQLALQLSIDANRSSFTTTLSRDRARYIALLVELDRPQEALCTILAARARHARALISRPGRTLDDPRYLERVDRYHARGLELHQLLDERRLASGARLPSIDAEIAQLRNQRASLSSEAIALLEREFPPAWSCAQTWTPSEDVALLTMHPRADQQGWWFALARADQIQLVAIEPEPNEDDSALLARALDELDAQTSMLSGLSRLSVVPIGRMTGVDVHSLPRFTSPDAPQVHYSVALGPSAHAPAREDESEDLDARVLVFEDNLAHVEAEGEAVRERLRGRGWDLGTQWTPSETTRPALLHYAGHGYHRGLSGWDSALAEGSELSSRSLLASQRSPRVVVLSACEAGSSDPDTIDGGMNIAFAFLLAGAQLVIAPDQPVDDALALAFSKALYDELPTSGTPSEAHWLDALATISARQPSFAAWRAWLR